ncbi:MAG TPA: methyltransferase domain-containing protein [Candidatus Nanopelagicales bacterium]
MDAEQWNERYLASEAVWSAAPNPALVRVVPPVPQAGALALDVGCGEGADAVWLAGRGWQVVGVDWAGVALDRARRAAADRGVAARFVEGDATDARFLAGLSPTGRFELVTLAFIHPEPEERSRAYAHLPGLLAPGGVLLVIAHDPEHGRRGLPGPPPHRLLSAGDILAALALEQHRDLAVERAEVVQRADEAGGVVAVDAVVLVRRRIA